MMKSTTDIVRRLRTPVALALLLSAARANGQEAVAQSERILLQEVMPTLVGTPVGAVDVAQAPAPGSSLTIHRADVQRALTQAGLQGSLKAKDIPKTVKVSRESVKVTRDELSIAAHEAVRNATAPCELGDVRYPSDVKLSAGPRSYRAEFNGLRSGSLTGAVFVTSGGRDTRVPVIASLSCPPPEITAGAHVIAVAQVGPVKATAPAEARQPGRVGEIIRITNRATGASLRARILNSRTVEVVQ